MKYCVSSCWIVIEIVRSSPPADTAVQFPMSLETRKQSVLKLSIQLEDNTHRGQRIRTTSSSEPSLDILAETVKGGWGLRIIEPQGWVFMIESTTWISVRYTRETPYSGWVWCPRMCSRCLRSHFSHIVAGGTDHFLSRHVLKHALSASTILASSVRRRAYLDEYVFSGG